VRVLLGSADANLRLSVELLLSEEPGVTIVGAAMSADGLLALAAPSNPNMAVIDWDLPGKSIDQLVQEIRHIKVPLGIILLGTKSELKQSALLAGADTFVVKGSPPERLLEAFRGLRNDLVQATVDANEQKEDAK
jgi:DNA-binding NarL/FixJ family response regulator